MGEILQEMGEILGILDNLEVVVLVVVVAQHQVPLEYLEIQEML